jgi:hypothetical protein
MSQDLVEDNRKLKHESALKEMMYIGECARLEQQIEELKEQLRRVTNSRNEMPVKNNQMTREKHAAQVCGSQTKYTLAQLQHEVGELRQNCGTHFSSSLNVCLSY